MTFTILTLFPQMFASVFNYSIIKRAQEKKLLKINLINIRDFATDKHKTVDDRPYGGGVGMVLKINTIDRALTKAKQLLKFRRKQEVLTVLLDPKGKLFTQVTAHEFSLKSHIILICGHYEGVDERVNKIVDMKLSLGKYILTGGEIASMAIVDSITRLIPQVLVKSHSTKFDTFTGDFVEPPLYTRPRLYKNMRVPKVLLSGDHDEIIHWKETHAHKIKNQLQKNIG